MKTRTTLMIDDQIITLARVQAVKEQLSLSQLVEKLLKNYLPSVITTKLDKTMQVKFKMSSKTASEIIEGAGVTPRKVKGSVLGIP